MLLLLILLVLSAVWLPLSMLPLLILPAVDAAAVYPANSTCCRCLLILSAVGTNDYNDTDAEFEANSGPYSDARGVNLCIHVRIGWI